MRSVAPATSDVQHTGSDAITSGVGRPAASAAHGVIVRPRCSPAGSPTPVIQVTVPSVTVPASVEHLRGPRAATTSRGRRLAHGRADRAGRHRAARARAVDVDGLAAQHRDQRVEVLAHVGRGRVEAVAPEALDDDLVRQPDAEREGDPSRSPAP